MQTVAVICDDTLDYSNEDNDENPKIQRGIVKQRSV